MAVAGDCNTVIGPVIANQNQFRSVFCELPRKKNAENPRMEAPNHVELPFKQQKLAFTLDHVLDRAECEALISAAESSGFKAAGIGSTGKQEFVESIRSSTRILSDDPQLAAILWQRIRRHVPLVLKGRWVLGLNERLRYLKYSKGQKFAAHFDGCFRRAGTKNESCLTVQLYLSDVGPLDGGATRFLGGQGKDGKVHGAVDCMPVQGRALIFVHNTLHEGAEVTGDAVKYTIRTDIEYGPSWWLPALQGAVGMGASPEALQGRCLHVFALALPLFCWFLQRHLQA